MTVATRGIKIRSGRRNEKDDVVSSKSMTAAARGTNIRSGRRDEKGDVVSLKRMTTATRRIKIRRLGHRSRKGGIVDPIGSGIRWWSGLLASLGLFEYRLRYRGRS